ncbi:MAG: hypothetical protein Q8S31_08875 [Alphaproteobacteria bacterium]|nr:hypothetical protein [Alphaproteobacteria bacterium]
MFKKYFFCSFSFLTIVSFSDAMYKGQQPNLLESSSLVNERKINFVHGLSEFTTPKMSSSSLAFFKKHGCLAVSELNKPENVEIFGSYAVDIQSALGSTKSNLNVLLGQNIETKNFYAFKHINDPSREINGLEKLNRFYEIIIINGHNYIAIDLIDGVPITNFLKIREKCTPEVIDLLVKNLLLSLKELYTKKIWHEDLNPDNIMIDVRNWSVSFIDFDSISIDLEDNFSSKYSFYQQYSIEIPRYINYLYSEVGYYISTLRQKNITAERLLYIENCLKDISFDQLGTSCFDDYLQ